MRNEYYSPSWLYRFRTFISRFSLPWILVYLLLALFLLGMEITLLLLGGRGFSINLVTPTMVFYAALGPYILAYIHFLANTAKEAVAQLSLSQLLPKKFEEEITYKLTVAPSRPTLLASLAGFLTFLFLLALQLPILDLITVNTVESTHFLRLFEGAVFWTLTGAAIAYIVHQLVTINDINTNYLPTNLHHLEPLYKLSSIPIRTAIGQTLIPAAIFLLFPSLLSDPSSLLLAGLGFLFSLLIIFAPLRTVHQLLEEDKLRKQTRNAKSLDKALTKLHQTLAQADSGEHNILVQDIATLYKERDDLRNTPTWPWKPGALRNAMATLTLPMVIWLLQRVLGTLF